MKILVACEFSGVVRDAFIRKGHDATSVDIYPSLSKFGPHIQGKVQDIGDLSGYEMMICHPPCRYMAVSGARWFSDPERKIKQEKALEFVQWLLAAPIERICLENPVSIISSKIKPPSQIIHPWQFGHTTNKTICFWYKNLPKLKPTQLIPEWKRTNEIHEASPSWNRNRVRSIFFRGIANAMADQWTN